MIILLTRKLMIASFLLFSTLAEKENKFDKTIGRSLGFHSQQ